MSGTEILPAVFQGSLLLETVSEYTVHQLFELTVRVSGTDYFCTVVE